MFCTCDDKQLALWVGSAVAAEPLCPLWVLGGVEFEMDRKELHILFGVQCGILGPRQSFYIEGGRFVARGVI